MDGEKKQTLGTSTSSWAQKIAEDTAKDKREQPWKALLGETHDKGADGEDFDQPATAESCTMREYGCVMEASIADPTTWGSSE